MKIKNIKYIYVLDSNGKPLMPTKRLGMVRRWLTSGHKQASSADNINKRHLNNNAGLVNTGARHVIDNYKPVNASVRPKLVPVNPKTPALPQTANTVNTGNSSAVSTASQNSASVLPQTGSKKELGLVALGLIAISLSVFGLKDPDKEKS